MLLFTDKVETRRSPLKFLDQEFILKPCLVEIAHAALKDKEHTYYANKFNKLSKHRGKRQAYIAIARKILVAVITCFLQEKHGIQATWSISKH